MKNKLKPLDKRYGWVFGCDGFVSTAEACETLGFGTSYLCELLRELRATGPKRPTDRTWPLRAYKDSLGGIRSPWLICRRSVEEYAKRRQPHEV